MIQMKFIVTDLSQFKTKGTVFQKTSIDGMLNARARENLGFISVIS